MKALILKRYGGPDHVVFADIPRPVPNAGEILVQVHAVGLNPIDNMIAKGMFKPHLVPEQGAAIWAGDGG